MMEDTAAIAAAMARELAGKDQPMEVLFTPMSVFQFVALLQLVGRHPGLLGELREKAAAFIAAARVYFADCPTVLAVIAQGDDPTQDVRTWGE